MSLRTGRRPELWKSRALYLLALLASAALAAFFEDKNVGYTLLYALLIFPVLSFATVAAAPLLLRVDESADREAVFKGEELRYTLRVRNRSVFFYPRAECPLSNAGVVGYGGEAAPVEFLGPRGRVTREYAVRFPYRGVYRLGAERLTVTDFLGLFRRTVYPQRPLSVTVYPESDDGFALLLRSEPRNSSLNRDLWSEDYTAVADVRKYTASDSLRKIHWKLSAKRGELIVKNFQSYEPDRTLLFLDTVALPLSGIARASFEDKMVSYAAAAVNHCLQGRLPAELVYGDIDAQRMAIGGSGEIGGVFAALAGAEFGREASALHAAGKLGGAYNLIVFLACVDEALHDRIRELISFDHEIVLFFFSSIDLPLTGEARYLLESLRAYGAAVNLVPVEGEGGEALL